MLSRKLAELEIDLPALKADPSLAAHIAPRGSHESIRLEGVSPFSKVPGDDGSTVLSAKDSISLAGDQLTRPDLVVTTSHQIQSAFFRALWLAASASNGNIDAIERCLVARVYVVTTPNFRDIGHFAMILRKLGAKLFGAEKAPLTSAIGVVSLPGGSKVAVDCEFLIGNAR